MVRSQYINCRACELCDHRTQVTFATPNPGAKIALVIDAPSDHDDRHGHLLTGRSGDYIDAVLQDLGAPRREIYVTAAVKCLAPNNRAIRKSEISACSQILDLDLIELRGVKSVVAMGLAAAKAMLSRCMAAPLAKTIPDLRGTTYSMVHPVAAPLVVTYKPDMALRGSKELVPGRGEVAIRQLIIEDLKRAIEMAGHQ